MNPGDLTTVAAVEAYGTIQSNSATDANIQTMISAVSAMFYRMTNLPVTQFSSMAYSEKYNGNDSGRTTLMLRHSPIISVESLIIDTQTIPASPDGIQAGFIFDDLMIYLIGYGFRPPVSGFTNYQFGPGVQNIQVQYHAGYTQVPYDLVDAANLAVALWFKQVKNLGEKSVNIQGAVATHDQAVLPPRTLAVFETYKNRVPFMS